MSATSISTADAKTSAQSIFENLDKLEARERMVGQLTPIQGIFRGHRCGRSAGIPEFLILIILILHLILQALQ